MSKRSQHGICNLHLKSLWVGVVVITAFVPIRLAIAGYQAPLPQAIFVLGGDRERMVFAAQFWRSHSDLEIWISDFAVYETENRQIFRQAGVPDRQVKFDGRATDTVTNFTTLVEVFSRQSLQHLYLVTSDYHMRRVRAIAAIVFGSRGIIVTPISVPSRGDQSETLIRVLRDCGRSILWLVTGWSGASLNPRLRAYHPSLLKILHRNS
jgi:uncharacterized SAM-binding protein YcdF (DUF218 family)